MSDGCVRFKVVFSNGCAKDMIQPSLRDLTTLAGIFRSLFISDNALNGRKKPCESYRSTP